MSELKKAKQLLNSYLALIKVTPARFEPATATFVVWYSIQLSYGAICECKYNSFFPLAITHIRIFSIY